MAAHLGKRKRCRADDIDVNETKALKSDRMRTQQPTPPTSTRDEIAYTTRNYIDFDFDSICPPFPNLKSTGFGAVSSPKFDIIHDNAIKPPPSPCSNHVDGPYDPDFGEKVCARWLRIGQNRKRRYGFAIAAVFPPGRTPLAVRRAEEYAQGELKKRFEVDFGGGGLGSQEEGEAYEGEGLESEEDGGEDLEHGELGSEAYQSEVQEREGHKRADHESAEYDSEEQRSVVHEKEEEAQNDGNDRVRSSEPHATPPGSCSSNNSWTRTIHDSSHE